MKKIMEKNCLNCVENAGERRTPIDSREVVILTHPFYLHLSHMHRLDAPGKKAARAYLDSLTRFLETNHAADRMSVVALETVHHYAAATSLLMENGLINRTIFTEYNNGSPIDENELIPLSGSIAFLGGGYVGRCLRSSTYSLRGVIPDRRLWAVRDFLLNAPENGAKFKRGQKLELVKRTHLIGLNKLIRRVGLDLGRGNKWF